MRKQCIGIDISSKTFTSCLVGLRSDGHINSGPVKRFPNEKKGFQQLMRYKRKAVERGVTVVFLMEATGVYHQELAYFLHQLGETIHVVLANTSKHYFKSLNVKTKTDDLDARILGRFGVEREHREWTPPSALMSEVKHLVRHKLQLQEQKTALSNIKHSRDRSHDTPVKIMRSSTRIIKVIEKEIAAIEVEIERVVNSDKEIAAKVARICTTKGLGVQTVAGVIAETDGFALFRSAKQLVSYAGYDVVHNESGSFKGATRISKKGNRYIRHLLYFPAMSASKSVPEFVALRKRMKARTSIPMKGQVAIQRKLLILIYTLWKTDSEYIEGYHQKKIARTDARATQDSANTSLSLKQS